MKEKRYIVSATRAVDMTAVVYATSKEEAWDLAMNDLEVEWEYGDQNDSIDKVEEEE